jgi:hypothetical protein
MQAEAAFRRFGYHSGMQTFLPVMSKREIAREVRLGSDRTDDAVLKTLKNNQAISDGIIVKRRAGAGRLAGSDRFFCSLNRDAARAFRRKDRDLAIAYAKAAERVEALDDTRSLVHEIVARGVATSGHVLAVALAEPAMLQLTRAVASAIQVELAQLPKSDVTTFSGRVVKLSADGAVIELSKGGTRLPIPRSILDEAGLASEGAALAARWEMAGDGMMVMAVEPIIDDPSAGEDPPVDVYGTPWGRVLASDDAPFVQALLARPPSAKRGRPTRVRIPIGE